ncbi:MAG: hypothetical protein ACYS9Y_04295 [Planctomycetota bacterium]|jgi:hypothetical protein
MNSNLISMLQSQMDKCTTEQFWVVGVSTGLGAFLISESNIIQQNLPNRAIIGVQAFLSLCVISFVVHRHKSFYNVQSRLRKLLKDEAVVSNMFANELKWWQFRTLSGVAFYTFWTLLTCAGVISCYI